MRQEYMNSPYRTIAMTFPPGTALAPGNAAANSILWIPPGGMGVVSNWGTGALQMAGAVGQPVAVIIDTSGDYNGAVMVFTNQGEIVAVF